MLNIVNNMAFRHRICQIWSKPYPSHGNEEKTGGTRIGFHFEEITTTYPENHENQESNRSPGRYGGRRLPPDIHVGNLGGE
jgi:hypothetical protein